MRITAMKEVSIHAVLILASAVPGAVLAWWLLRLAGLGGTWLAGASAMLAMLFATALFIALVGLARAVGLLPRR
jgi:hypothetical protein